MKTAALLLCCAAIGFYASAQTDTTRNAFRPKSDTSNNAFRSNPSPTLQNPALNNNQPFQPQTQYRVGDRILIQHNELPNSLRETLMGNQYKGWENSQIYQDRTSGEYYFTPNNTNTTTPNTNTGTNRQGQQPSYYRFDRNGKAISGSPARTGNDQ